MLRAEHLVGRSTRSDLCINADHISAQHAAIRWNGEKWEVRDLGSRNGTRVNGVPLAQSQAEVLQQGSKLSFGSETEMWELVDASPPAVMAVSLETEAVVLPDGDILAIPSSSSPEIVLFRGEQATWEREEVDGSFVTVRDQDRLVTRNGRWQFCCPHVVARTSSLADRPNLTSIGLELRVSLDEEHVEATVLMQDRRLSLGARAHHYLLLTLARHRLEDQGLGHPPSACGWIYVEDLLAALRISPEQLNLDVFRIRQQFGSLGFARPVEVIERRPRTRQLRLGLGNLSVHRG